MLIAESLRPEHFGHARTGAVEITDAPLPRQANEPPGDSGGSLYAPHVKIYPKRAHGSFRTAKWIVMAVTLGIYYLVPWIRWDRGSYLPDQAVLIDFPARRFYFFFLEIWPQEFYYITGLLVLASLALFLVTSVAGRVWCGYTCPQTVWTDLMIAVERFFQGDRNQRLKLAKAPWSVNTLSRRGATTYVLGGLAREQVCIYMCPWPRIQGAMFDRDSLLITYRGWRGEPRGPHKAGQSWEGRGDCIDCKQCIAVCPTGIDIRNGPQLECIQCALCIDACDEIMTKVERPRGLIAYDTESNLAAAGRETVPIKLIRPRTILYAGAMAVVSAIMLTALLLRPDLDVNVLRDRNPLFVKLSDGGVRNGYTIKLMNKLYAPRALSLSLEGLPGAKLSVVGLENEINPSVTVPPDELKSIRLYVNLDKQAVAALGGVSTSFDIVIADVATGERMEHSAIFQGP